jgi:hypothetical protein
MSLPFLIILPAETPPGALGWQGRVVENGRIIYRSDICHRIDAARALAEMWVRQQRIVLGDMPDDEDPTVEIRTQHPEEITRG